MNLKGNEKIQNTKYRIQNTDFLFSVLCLLSSVFFFASCGSGGGSGGGSSYVTISGVVQFEDRTFDSTGFTGTQNKAVRFADIEIVNSSDSSIVTSTSTDQNGNYSVTISPSSSSVYVRCLTSTSTVFSKGTKVYNIEVVDNYSNVYSIVSGSFSATSPISHSKNLTASLDSGAGGPFNILDTLIDGTEFVASKNGGFTSNKVKAIWYDGNKDGTYYSTATNNLYLLGKSGDSDSYDDMVILHEFGHWVAGNFSKDDSPGGTHTITGYYDIRLAWSEGWASFFGSSVRSYAGYSNPEYYVDTTGGSGNGNLLFYYEIKTPSYSSLATGSDNELSVSSVLWNIFSSAGFNGIWDVVKNYLPSTAEISLEDFWDGWFSKGYDSTLNPSSIFSNRSIEYSSDSYESESGDNNSSQAEAVNFGESLHHTYYPLGDEDWISFSATNGTTYTIETLSLTNGADTHLFLYNTDGTTLITFNVNDYPYTDDRSLTDKSSLITWTATATGTYYVRSKAYSDSGAISTYGSYDLKVQQQKPD
ncbi:MAG TPA: hypothetical protein DCQ99_07890 [Nitrospinae bacterium]|nr:hypothetical protein [Nitrospinota bacterium]HBA26677.1 hypothetical protein [Nitrospinota bacterium]